MLRTAYPAPRERREPIGPRAETKWERYDTRTGTVADTTFVDLGRFSGTPDAILLVNESLTAAVWFRLTDVMDREASEIMVPPADAVMTYLARRRVFAARVSGAGNVEVAATGFWAQRGEATDGEQEPGDPRAY